MAEGNGAVSAGSLRRTRTMAEGNGERGACCLRRNCTLAEGNRAGDTGSLRRYSTVRIFDSPWARNRGNLCCVIGQMATGTRASCETNGGAPDSAVGVRVGSGVPHRRTVICRCGKHEAGARSGFRSGCGQPRGIFREQPREYKRRARVVYHHGDQTSTGYRGYHCDCLPGLGPGGTPAFDLNDCDNFSWSAR